MTPRKKQPHKAAVELTQRALADLHEIEVHSVAEWGRKTADQYLNHIAAALDRLAENPQILRLEPDFSPGLYFYRVRKQMFESQICDC